MTSSWARSSYESRGLPLPSWLDSKRSSAYAPLGTTVPADTNEFSIDTPPTEAQTNVLLRRSLDVSIDYVIPEEDSDPARTTGVLTSSGGL